MAVQTEFPCSSLTDLPTDGGRGFLKRLAPGLCRFAGDVVRGDIRFYYRRYKILRYLRRHRVTLQRDAAGRWCVPMLRGKWPVFEVDPSGYLEIGPGCTIESEVYFKVGPGAKLILGSRININKWCRLFARNSIVIEDGVKIGWDTEILDSGGHERYPGDPHPPKPILLKRNTWVGKGVSILGGVTTGENVIVGADTSLRQSVPANSTVYPLNVTVLGHHTPPPGWVRA